jgi:hypothetical protein
MAEMTRVSFVERGDHWIIPLGGETVTQCRYDYALTLVVGEIDPSFYIRIEQPFALHTAEEAVEQFDPEGDPQEMGGTLRLLRSTVTRSVAYKNGRLEIEFDNGSVLQVSPSADYEPWQLSGPDGLRMVPAAGGDLVVWS